MPFFARWVAAFACAVLLTTRMAHADSADELARKHFESGAAYLEQADYESALREFNAAYELSKRAEILLNVATVHERMSHLKEAVAALEQYVAEDPQGEHVETTKIRIENLKKRIAEEPPESPAAAAPAPTPAPAPAVAPAAPPQPTAPPATEAKPRPSRTPAYVLFATGGALGIASIVTGILAQDKHSDAEKTCSPNCTDDQLASGRALAVTSTVLTGATVVAGAVGAVLFFGSGGDEHAAVARPRVGVGFLPHGAAASASWRF
jgi:hypothetical protein